MNPKANLLNQQLRLLLAVTFCLFMIAQLFSQRFSIQWDLSFNARYSIPTATENLFTLLPDDISIFVFTELNKDKQQVQKFLKPYRDAKANINLTFINPSENPKKARDLNYQAETPIILRYLDRQITLANLNKQQLHNALQQFTIEQSPWITFSQGFGERSPNQTTAFNYVALTKELDNLAYTSVALDLRSVSNVPNNTDILVLAAPTQEYDDNTLNKILAYLENGGQLFWLSDTDSPALSEQLSNYFGVQLLPGILVDANSSKYIQNKPDFIPVESYANSELNVIKDFKLVTLFPQVRGLQIRDSDSTFIAAPSLQSSINSWTETSALRGDIGFDENSDEVAGPINIGVHLTRRFTEQRDQRILFLGDADFLADAYLGNGGNIDLALTLFQWLNHQDQLSQIETLRAPDKNLTLSNTAFYVINAVYLFIMPVLFIGLPILWLRLQRRRNRYEYQ